jgi:hypothetical protein
MPHFDVSDRDPWVRDPDAGMGYENQDRGLSASRYEPTSFVSAPRDKRPSDNEIDRLIDELALEMDAQFGANPIDSKRKILRRLVRDWHANN